MSKSVVLEVTCLKLHMEGQQFAPVQVADGVWELQSDTRVLASSTGKTFQFKSESTALIWVQSNLIRASKRALTVQEKLMHLQDKNLATPRDYLAEEIATMQAFSNGDFNINFQGEMLQDDWQIINAGLSNDEGNELELGEDGGVYYQAPEPKSGGGAGGVEVVSFIVQGTEDSNIYSMLHEKGRSPDTIELFLRSKVDKGGVGVGLLSKDYNDGFYKAYADQSRIGIRKVYNARAEYFYPLDGSAREQLAAGEWELVLNAIWA